MQRSTGAEPYSITRYDGPIGKGRFLVPSGTVVFARAVVSEADFSGQTFENFLATESVFESCDFRDCRWQGGVLSDIPPATFRNCRFDGADLRRVAPQFARFENCRFAWARLDDWDAMRAEFVDCTFEGRLSRVQFSGQPWGIGRERGLKLRASNAFSGNDFSGVSLEDCSILGGIDLDANKWPTDGYVVVRDRQDRIAQAHRLVASWPPSQRKRMAEAVLLTYSIGGFALQKDLFVRVEDLGPAGAALGEFTGGNAG